MTRPNNNCFPSTRLSLMGRLAGEVGDDWQTFFKIYGPIVFRMAQRAGSSAPDADEIVSTVMRSFLSVVRNGFEVDHRHGKFRQYLRSATNNAIRAQRRKNSKGAAVLLPDDLHDDEPPGDSSWDRLEKLERLRACFERLRTSPVVRRRDLEAFEAVVFAGEEPRVVAKRLQITVNRVYGIKHEVVQHLRQVREELDAQFGEV